MLIHQWLEEKKELTLACRVTAALTSPGSLELKGGWNIDLTFRKMLSQGSLFCPKVIPFNVPDFRASSTRASTCPRELYSTLHVPVVDWGTSSNRCTKENPSNQWLSWKGLSLTLYVPGPILYNVPASWFGRDPTTWSSMGVRVSTVASNCGKMILFSASEPRQVSERATYACIIRPVLKQCSGTLLVRHLCVKRYVKK